MTRPSTKTLILAKLTVNMSVFAGFAVASICYFQIGGIGHLPTDRPIDRDWTSHWSPNGTWHKQSDFLAN
jgi:hypothetical protein